MTHTVPTPSPSTSAASPAAGSTTRPGALAGVAIAGPVAFGAATLVAWAANPGTSPIGDSISALGATDVAHPGVITFGFVAMAIGAAAMAVLTRRSFHGGRGAISVPLLFATNAMATLVSGFARLDCSPAGAACRALEEADAVSGHHSLHNLMGIPTFLTLIVLPLFAARRFKRDATWGALASPSRRVSAACFALGIVFFLGLDHAVDGLVQRCLLGLAYGWMVVVALRLDRARNRAVAR